MQSPQLSSSELDFRFSIRDEGCSATAKEAMSATQIIPS